MVRCIALLNDQLFQKQKHKQIENDLFNYLINILTNINE
jgi:hypothetical protein